MRVKAQSSMAAVCQLLALHLFLLGELAFLGLCAVKRSPPNAIRPPRGPDYPNYPPYAPYAPYSPPPPPKKKARPPPPPYEPYSPYEPPTAPPYAPYSPYEPPSTPTRRPPPPKRKPPPPKPPRPPPPTKPAAPGTPPQPPQSPRPIGKPLSPPPFPADRPSPPPQPRASAIISFSNAQATHVAPSFLGFSAVYQSTTKTYPSPVYRRLIQNLLQYSNNTPIVVRLMGLRASGSPVSTSAWLALQDVVKVLPLKFLLEVPFAHNTTKPSGLLARGQAEGAAPGAPALAMDLDPGTVAPSGAFGSDTGAVSPESFMSVVQAAGAADPASYYEESYTGGGGGESTGDTTEGGNEDGDLFSPELDPTLRRANEYGGGDYEDTYDAADDVEGDVAAAGAAAVADSSAADAVGAAAAGKGFSTQKEIITKAAQYVGRDHVVGFEVGNEPNRYPKDKPSKYGYLNMYGFLQPGGWFEQDLTALSQGLAPLLTEKFGTARLLAGPVFSSMGVWLDSSNITKYLNRFGQCCNSMMTAHFYATFSHDKLSADSLLSEGTITHLTIRTTTWQTAVQRFQPGYPFRIGEYNSVAGGQSGVSDTMAAALWLLDSALAVAQTGAAGINVNGHSCSAYAPIWSGECNKYPGSAPRVNTPYYAMLMFQRAVGPPGSKLQKAIFAGGIKLWAIQRSPAVAASTGIASTIVLINKSKSRAKDVVLNITGLQFGSAGVLRLLAPSVYSTVGKLTLGGVQVAADGSVPPLLLEPVQLEFSNDGASWAQAVVQVPSGSAALLELRL